MARFRTRLALLGPAAVLAAAALAPVQLAGSQPAAAAAAYQWVALGDSYTAGVIPAAGDTFEVPRDGCERTDQSYPQVIDRDLGSLFDLTNVSCGAATIEDITFRAQHPIGRHLPPFSAGCTPDTRNQPSRSQQDSCAVPRPQAVASSCCRTTSNAARPIQSSPAGTGVGGPSI